MTSVSPAVANRCPRRRNSRAQLPEVVDLAVQDDDDRAVLVVDRLVAGLEVDDPQALDPQPDLVLEKRPRESGPRCSSAAHICFSTCLSTPVAIDGSAFPTIPHTV